MLSRRIFRAAFALVGACLAAVPSALGVGDVVVSQVWGQGAITGPSSDYVELFNRTGSPVSLAGWSVQVTTVTGTTWNKLDLPSVSIPANQYFLIRVSQAGTTGTGITPDVAFSPLLAGSILTPTGGKVALCNNTTFLTGSCPLPNAAVVDFLGWGTNADCREGSGTANNAPPMTTTGSGGALYRNGAGCTDTDVNSADFSLAAPAPRNLSSPAGSACTISGACCNNNTGACSTSNQAGCTGATVSYQGDASLCSSNPCPASGACCNLVTGVCTTMTAFGCDTAAGEYHGSNAPCMPSPCPPTGACCDFLSGVCTTTTLVGCTHGIFKGETVVCSSNPCPPRGACCGANSLGLCQLTIQAGCSINANYLGDNTTCGPPNPCPGRCCHSDGSCEFVTQNMCVGSWSSSGQPATACMPNICPQPQTGACCQSDGTCVTATPGLPSATCSSGTLFAGGSCTPNPCCSAQQPCAVAEGLYGIENHAALLRRLDTTSGAIVATIPLTLAGGGTISGGNGLARDPTTGTVYALLAVSGGGTARRLATVNLATAVATVVGSLGDQFSGITFSPSGTLYGVTGDGADVPESLYTIDKATAAKTLVLTLPGSDGSGEAVAFDRDDGKIYHASGAADDTPVFDSIDPATLAVTGITGGFIDEISGLVYAGDGSFYATDIENMLSAVSSEGSFTPIGSFMPLGTIRGLALVTAPSGVCCRGGTCSTSVTQADCTPAGSAGAAYTTVGPTCNAAGNARSPCCYADYNKSGMITVQDIFDFLGGWFAGSPYARIGGDGTGPAPTVQSIFDFLGAWFGGGC